MGGQFKPAESYFLEFNQLVEMKHVPNAHLLCSLALAGHLWSSTGAGVCGDVSDHAPPGETRPHIPIPRYQRVLLLLHRRLPPVRGPRPLGARVSLLCLLLRWQLGNYRHALDINCWAVSTQVTWFTRRLHSSAKLEIYTETVSTQLDLKCWVRLVFVSKIKLVVIHTT